MADYVKKLLEKDPLRLEGYTAYLTCINKAASEREIEKFKETVAQVKKCCEQLQNAANSENPKSNTPDISDILDSSGNVAEPYKEQVNQGLLDKIKAVSRALLMPEIKEVIVNVAKIAT